MATLKFASCRAKDTGQQLFDIKFHVGDLTPVTSAEVK